MVLSDANKTPILFSFLLDYILKETTNMDFTKEKDYLKWSTPIINEYMESGCVMLMDNIWHNTM